MYLESLPITLLHSFNVKANALQATCSVTQASCNNDISEVLFASKFLYPSSAGAFFLKLQKNFNYYHCTFTLTGYQ